MAVERLVRLPCVIYRSAFSSERQFQIRSSQAEYVSTAPVEYFWADREHRLAADEPRQRGNSVPGFVDARILSQRDNGTLLLSVPSGDVLEVDAAMVVEYPQETAAHVISFVNAKSTRARTGVIVHFTAPTIHANWQGKIVLDIANHGPFHFVLEENDVIAQLTVAMISSPPDERLKKGSSLTAGQGHATGAP